MGLIASFDEEIRLFSEKNKQLSIDVDFFKNKLIEAEKYMG